MGTAYDNWTHRGILRRDVNKINKINLGNFEKFTLIFAKIAKINFFSPSMGEKEIYFKIKFKIPIKLSTLKMNEFKKINN